MKTKTFFTFKIYHLMLLVLGFLIFRCGNANDVKSKIGQVKSNYNNMVVISPEIAKKISIKTGVLQRTTMCKSFTVRGKIIVNPEYVAHVNSLVPGKIRKIYVRIGDFVKKDQPVFELESMEIANVAADYSHDMAEFAAKKNERVEAQIRAEADRKLHALGFNEEDIKNILNSDNHRNGKITVKSPISGYIIENNIVLGQTVTSEMGIMKVVDNSHIWVESKIFEKDYANVSLGQQVSVTVPSFPGKKFSGKVIKMNKEVNEQSGTLTIFSELDQRKTGLISNIAANTEFFYGSPDTVLALSKEAVQFDGTDYFVFVEIEPYKYKKQNVITGKETKTMVEIRMGLDSSEKVVVEGAFFVRLQWKQTHLSK